MEKQSSAGIWTFATACEGPKTKKWRDALIEIFVPLSV
jgi:hypothetical protein